MVVVAMLIIVITAILIILIDIIGHLVVVLSYHRLRTKNIWHTGAPKAIRTLHWLEKRSNESDLKLFSSKLRVVGSCLRLWSCWNLNRTAEFSEVSWAAHCCPCRPPFAASRCSVRTPGHCERRCANLLALVDWGGWQVGQCLPSKYISHFHSICIYMCELRSYSPIYIYYIIYILYIYIIYYIYIIFIYIYITMFLQLKSYKIN